MKTLEFDAFHHRLDHMTIGYMATPPCGARISDMEFIHLIQTSPERLHKTLSQLHMEKFRIKLINYAYVIRVLRKEIIWHVDLECSMKFFEVVAMDLRFFPKLGYFRSSDRYSTGA